MRIEIQKFSGNFADSMRSAGYHYDGQDPKTGELRFYRSLSSGLFPRFHVYCLKTQNSKLLTINLHLDQKAPVYEGTTAHGGDYEGPIIEKEAAKIKSSLSEKSLPPIDIFE